MGKTRSDIAKENSMYRKVGISNRMEALKRYYENPVSCNECGKTIEVGPEESPTKVRDREFCTLSCSAKHRGLGRNNTYSPEVKEKCRKMRRSGHTYEEVKEELGVSSRTIADWTEDIETHHPAKKFDLSKIKKKHTLKKRLIEIRGHKCEGCENEKWRGQKIPLQIHRKEAGKPYEDCDGDDLELLCPNCHSQTDSWTGKAASK